MGGTEPEAEAVGWENFVLDEDAATLVFSVDGRGETVTVLVCTFEVAGVGVGVEEPPFTYLVTVTVSGLAVTVTVINRPAAELGCETSELVCTGAAEDAESIEPVKVAGADPLTKVCSAAVGLTRNGVAS